MRQQIVYTRPFFPPPQKNGLGKRLGTRSRLPSSARDSVIHLRYAFNCRRAQLRTATAGTRYGGGRRPGFEVASYLGHFCGGGNNVFSSPAKNGLGKRLVSRLRLFSIHEPGAAARVVSSPDPTHYGLVTVRA